MHNWRVRKILAVLAAGGLVVATASPALAAPVDVDTSFGSNGIATTPPPSGDALSTGSAVALDSSGDVLVAGEASPASTTTTPTSAQVVLTRFTSAGAVDTTFGSNGTVTVDLGGLASVAGMAVSSDGTIVVAADSLMVSSTGTPTGSQAELLEFTSTGTQVTTFGSSGKLVLSAPPGATVTGVAIDSTGNLVVSGVAAGTTPTPFVERLTSAGAADSTFGTSGVESLTGVGAATTVALTSDGHVLAGGITTKGLAVWRLTSAGQADTTWGAGGVANLTLPPLNAARALLPKADGSVIAVGAQPTDSIVAKLSPTGALDTSFGVSGITQVDLPGGDVVSGGAIDPTTGAITVAGIGGSTGGFVARLNADGSPDRTFAADGKAALPVTSTGAFLLQAGPVLQSDGKIVAGGADVTLPSSSSGTPTVQMGATRLLGGTGTATPPADTAGRLAGTDRIGTAIAVSQATFDTIGQLSPDRVPAQAVVLASGQNFPDALVGTPLAASLEAPLLLTNTASLDSRVVSEIERVIGPGSDGGDVTILGGTLAVSSAVEQQLSSAGYVVDRVAGPDRFATAVAVAQQIDPNLVIEATGLDFPDGVTAGAAAAHYGGAVLLTNGSQQAPATAQYLQTVRVPTYAVGGPAATADPSATSISGSDRYQTAVTVAQAFFVSPSDVGVATGAQFADALSGGSRAAMEGGPVLLTASTTLSPATAGYLQGLASWIDTADVYGGTLAVSDQVLSSIQQAISGPSAASADGVRLAGVAAPYPWTGWAAAPRWEGLQPRL